MAGKDVKKVIVVLIVVSVIFVPTTALFFTSYSMGVGNGIMENCLFNITLNFCPMSLFEHLSIWQNIFAANLPKVMIISLLFLLTSLGLTFSFFVLKQVLLKYFWPGTQLKLYLKQKPDIFLFDYLKEVFSQGILKPKIY